MRHGVGEIKEERLVLVALDELECPVGVALRQRRLNDRILDDVLAIDELDRPHVVAVENPEVLIETAVALDRTPSSRGQVPLADHARGITGLPKQLGQRDFGCRQAEFAVLAAEVGRGVGHQPQRNG